MARPSGNSSGPRSKAPPRGTPAQRSTAPGARTQEVPGQRFAVLLGGKAPQAELKLILADEGAPRVIYTPLASIELAPAEAGLGMLPLSGDRHVQRVRQVGAYRGRLGGKKPDPLLLLQAAPPGFAQWPRVRREGMSKAALELFAELCREREPDPARAWLAVELAIHGNVHATHFRELCQKLDLDTSLPPEAVVKAGGLLVSTDWVSRTAEQLQARARKIAAHNPFWRNIDLAHVEQWLEASERALPMLVFERLLAMPAAAAPSSVKMKPADDKAVDALLAMAEGEEPVLRRQAEYELPSHLHVLAGMLEAHAIVASPYGVLFSRRQLEDFGRRLAPLRKRPSELPGVGEIKETLGLGRRKAEALRDILAAWSWLIPAPQRSRPRTAAPLRSAPAPVRRSGPAPPRRPRSG